MIVIGKYFFVLEGSGKSCTVNPFKYFLISVKDIPITLDEIDYDWLYSHKCYILICRNALYIPNMEDNLLPSFIMRESGATVNDTTNIHFNDPTSKDHCIKFACIELKITLHINTFDLFHTRRHTDDEIHSCENILITTDHQHYNPYCTSYELN